MFMLRARDSNLNREIKYRGDPSYEQVLDCLCQEIDDCIEALTCEEPEKFDAHVGETNCQTRAFMVAVLMNGRIQRSTMLRILEEKRTKIAELRQELLNDREATRNLANFGNQKDRKAGKHPFPKRVYLVPWLTWHNLTIKEDETYDTDAAFWDLNDFSCLRLLCFLYFLTKYREKTFVDDMPTYRLVSTRLTDLRKHILKAYQQFVAEATVELIRSLGFVHDSFVLRCNSLNSVATWISWRLIKKSWLEDYKFPLLVLSRYYCSNSKLHKVYWLFKVENQNLVSLRADCLKDEEAVIIVKGDSFDGNRKDFHKLEAKNECDLGGSCEKFEQHQKECRYRILETLDTFFAIHPPFVGPNNFVEKLKEVNIELFKEYSDLCEKAKKMGTSDSNMKLFLPQHMYTVSANYVRRKLPQGSVDYNNNAM